MVKLEYSQIVRKKLKKLKIKLTQNYGEDQSKVIMSKITKGLRKLETFPQSGTRVSLRYDITCDYYYIYVEHNYFFYRIKDCDTVLILEIFDEKEDFMKKLFGIATTSQETIDYWGE